MRRLRDEGKSFIFISHKMTEIFEIADRYTVLRNGRMIQSGNIRDITPTEVTKMMVGDSYSDADIYAARELGEPVLELENYSGHGFENVSLCIRKGEVVGFTGLKGAGVSELMQTIFGVLPSTGGTLKVEGQTMEKNTIHRAMRHKVAMIAANRKENSILPDFTLLENNYVSEHTLSRKKPLIHKKLEKGRYARLHDLLNIKANSEGDLITSLSGGNQQKVILARWLATNPDLLMLDEPTRGIDVAAKVEIYNLMNELKQNGIGVFFVSSEMPEIMGFADRIIVMCDGRVTGELMVGEATQEKVLEYATRFENKLQKDRAATA